MFGVPWFPGFVLGLPPRDGFWKLSKWPWNMIHSMPCRNPCRLYIHIAFTYILCWSLKRSVKRTWTGSTLSTNESAWSVMVTGSQSRVWNGPKYMWHIGWQNMLVFKQSKRWGVNLWQQVPLANPLFIANEMKCVGDCEIKLPIYETIVEIKTKVYM